MCFADGDWRVAGDGVRLCEATKANWGTSVAGGCRTTYLGFYLVYERGKGDGGWREGLDWIGVFLGDFVLRRVSGT